MSFGSTNKKIFLPTPPEKGSFPLDHFGECKQKMKEYLDCLRKNENIYNKCLEESKKYLQCRMENNLMSKEDFSKLGFRDNEEFENVEFKKDRKKFEKEFIAGFGLVKKKEQE